MRINFIASILLLCSLNAQSGVLEDFDAESIRDAFALTSLCGTRETGIACLGLPWSPGIGEGVFIVSNKGYILLRKDRRSAEFNELVSRFPTAKSEEYSAILATVFNDPKSLIGAIGVGTVFVCWVNVTNGEITFESVTKFDLRDLVLFKSAKTKVFLTELKASVNLWEPPEGFFPNYDFAFAK